MPFCILVYFLICGRNMAARVLKYPLFSGSVPAPRSGCFVAAAACRASVGACVYVNIYTRCIRAQTPLPNTHTLYVKTIRAHTHTHTHSRSCSLSLTHTVYGRYLRAKMRLRQADVTSTAAASTAGASTAGASTAGDTCNTAAVPAPGAPAGSAGNVELAKTLVADARR